MNQKWLGTTVGKGFRDIPECTAHMILNAGPPISSNGFFLEKHSQRTIPQEKTSHFSEYLLPSNTSGAIQAALPCEQRVKQDCHKTVTGIYMI